MSDEAQLTSVVVTLDDERSCTKAVRALRREYPTATDMPIFVRAVNEKHRRKMAASSATALETGPEESALMLGGALLASLGTPKQEVLSLIDDMRASMFTDRMSVIRDSFVERKPRGKKKAAKEKRPEGGVVDVAAAVVPPKPAEIESAAPAALAPSALRIVPTVTESANVVACDTDTLELVAVTTAVPSGDTVNIVGEIEA